MNVKDFDKIETALKITLPRQYREQMVARESDLTELDSPRGMEIVYPLASQVISENRTCRKRSDPLADSFPRWWEQFVLIGTNGAAEYYALKLTGDTALWRIGEEHGPHAIKVDRSLKAFIDGRLKRHRSPPPLPSSFDRKRPLAQRFDLRFWEDRCVIEPQEGDRPFTLEKLRQHGIRIADLRKSVKRILAALTGLRPSSIQFSDPPQEVDEEGNLAICFEEPTPRDPRVTGVTASFFNGNIKLWFKAADRNQAQPPLKETPVNWKDFEDGVSLLFQTLIPSIKQVRVAAPTEEGWWEFRLKYTLK